MSKDIKNKIVPKLRFPEFSNSVQWEESRVKKVFSVFQGFAFSSDDSSNQGNRWLKIADVSMQQMNQGTPSFLPVEFKVRFQNFLVKKGDYVIALTRPILNRQLKIAQVDEAFDGALLNQRVGKLVSDNSVDFVYHLLQTDQLISLIEKNIAGSEPPNLSFQQIGDIAIYIPWKKEEQQKIADCLSSLDKLITAQSQKLQALKAYKKGLMQQLFPAEGQTVPKRRFAEFKDGGIWEEKTLGELLQFKNGINASKEQYGKGIKFINVLDILQNEFITYEKIIGSVDVSDEMVNNFSVTYGDILFQRSSETQEEVGTANVYLDKECTATFGGFVIRGKKTGEYNPIFLNKLLKTQTVRHSINSKAGGSTRFNIGQETLSSLKISLPFLNEQQKIADCLSSLDELIKAQTEKIEALKAHKKGLMQGLFPSINKT